MSGKTTVAVFLLFSLVAVSGVADKRFCYFASWHYNRLDLENHTVSHVDPSLCSHLCWCFATLEDFKENTTVKEFLELTSLKEHQHGGHLKVLLSIGGDAVAATKFQDMLSNQSKRADFINDTIVTLRRNKFDGLNLGLGSSLSRVARPEVRQELSVLLKEMNEAYEMEAKQTATPRLQLVIAVPQHLPDIMKLFDVREVTKWVDYIIVIGHDFHRYAPRPHITSHHTPLYEPNWTGPFGTITNINYVVTRYIRFGVPPGKLVVQLPTFARAFNLSDPRVNGVDAPIKGLSHKRNYSGEAGVLSYHEVCEVLQTGGTEVWSDQLQVPYLYKGDLWAGYDNPKSLRNKVRWLKALGLAGYAVWEIGLDDVEGVCGNGTYPLLTALSDELLNGTEPPFTVPDFLTVNKSGPCVDKMGCYDCDSMNPFVYHECMDGLVVFTGECDSWGMELLFAIGVGRCVSIDEFQQHVICDETQGIGYPPEYDVMKNASLPGMEY